MRPQSHHLRKAGSIMLRKSASEMSPMVYRASFVRRLVPFAFGALIVAIGCGGGGSANTPPPPPVMSLSLYTSSVDIQQDGNLETGIPVTVTNPPGPVTFTVTGLPIGISAEVTTITDPPNIDISGGKNVP